MAVKAGIKITHSIIDGEYCTTVLTEDVENRFKNGELNMIESHGNKYWFKNGEYHKEGGPAIDHNDGYKAWYLNGLRHREDGPAREWFNGDEEWYLNGIEINEKKIRNKI